MTPDRKGCVDKNECLDSPCRNGGVCLNQDPRIRYRCICPDGFWGENCELVQEGQKLKLGMGALAAILVCLLIILSESRYLSRATFKTENNSLSLNVFSFGVDVCRVQSSTRSTH